MQIDDIKPGLWRRIRIEPSGASVRADIEDDFHRFGITLHHEGGRIVAVQAETIRYPWTTCPGAGSFLADRLVGHELREAAGFDRQLSHCTHLFDLALVAAAHAGDTMPTLFDMIVSDPVQREHYAVLRRNGTPLLHWHIKDSIIQAPTEPAGKSLKELRHWLRDLPEEMCEPATILRRAVFVSTGRRPRLSEIPVASMITAQRGACYTFDPIRSSEALRLRELRRDFSVGPAIPLGDIVRNGVDYREAAHG